METDAIVLSVKPNQVEAFEAGFRQHEVPLWQDFVARGIMVRASLTKMDISSAPRAGAIQYLIVAVFASDEGHHLHDSDPRFEAWNRIADTYQVGDGMAFGGETLLHVGG
jgi:hypothetical protein